MAMDLTAYPGVNSFFDLLNGELQQFNRLAGGPIVKYKIVSTADTAVVAGPAILYGAYLLAAGTLAGIYDNPSAASGNLLIPSTAASVHFNGIGILCDNGIYADWTSGSWLILYVDGN
jgi:hypothetical protein